MPLAIHEYKCEYLVRSYGPCLWQHSPICDAAKRPGKTVVVQGRREVFEAQEQQCRIRKLCVCDRSEQKGQKARELNLEALLEPCRLLLLGGSLNTSKEAINKSFDIS